MCGIAGMFLRQGEADPARLDAATAALAHRGPDGQGRFVEGGVALLHTRLSIIDLAHGGQPLTSPDGRQALVANGEIYNHVELREALEAAGHRFATHSDCESALHGYREWGDAFVGSLVGMFALALYDRQRQQLVLVRDRLGIKPLFIREDARGVYFGSEMKAIFALTGERPRVAAAGLVEYLQNNFVSGRHTLVEGVQRVLPGEMVVVGREGIVRRHTYWSPRAAAFDGTEQDAIEHFDGLMRDVLRIHVRSDVPYGLFLSGGVDSASLLALLAEHAGTNLDAYSVGFKDAKAPSELPAAERMARRFGARHHVLELDRDQLLGALPHAVWAADDLMGDYANLPVALLGQRCAQDLKIVFSGEGGDEVFAGYGRYRAPRLRRWLKQLAWPGSGGFRMSRTVDRAWEGRLYREPLMACRDRWAEPFIERWQALPANLSDLARMQAVDIQTWLPDDLLVKADRMLMAWGVECRVPFLDHRIVEFGLGLPAPMKVEGRTGKVLLRKWAERYLPRDHIWSRKRGFTVPIGRWLQGDLLDRLERALARHAGVREWFHPAGLQALFARQRTRADQAQVLWRIWQFAIWHALFVGGDGAEPARHADPVSVLDAPPSP